MSVKMRTTRTWTERPYEASLFPGIGFGLFLRSLGGRRRRPPSGGPEPSVRYHSGRARILTLCQDLRAKGQPRIHFRKKIICNFELSIISFMEMANPLGEFLTQRRPIDLACFIALGFRHQTDHNRKGLIYLGPYVTHLASHIRMIERQHGVGSRQYILSHSDPQDEHEEFPDDNPPLHVNPPRSLPPTNHPIATPIVTVEDLS
ncbi:hypothetical protein GOBAR_AA00490 [Gossypium barbadense]|uniref:Uncharacterized protein n=1 Tax=Gossypium barbadense TaxID=3634 RepID=A0A2P5YWY5_GOSBA|nr:hypothetical protein GOBAR_AA00490 [Gossypium barbadense]